MRQGRGDMRFEQGLASSVRALDDAVGEQLDELRTKLSRLAKTAIISAAIAIGLVVEIGMRGEQACRAAGGDQRGVKALVQRVEGRLALAEAARDSRAI